MAAKKLKTRFVSTRNIEWEYCKYIVQSDNVKDKCICELNKEGESVTGWCDKHHTDWI